MKAVKVFISGLWPVLLIFLPTWLCNLIRPSGRPTVWNPLDIVLLWRQSVLGLYAYSVSYGIGVIVVVAICLWWWLRHGGFFYGMLLFFAAFMAGPTWGILLNLWHYFALSFGI